MTRTKTKISRKELESEERLCICCATILKRISVWTEQCYDGVTFSTNGWEYGSRVFDTAFNGIMNVYICDDCLVRSADRITTTLIDPVEKSQKPLRVKRGLPKMGV